MMLTFQFVSQVRNLLHERALHALPGSYKLWWQYLQERQEQVKDLCVTDELYEDVNNSESLF